MAGYGVELWTQNLPQEERWEIVVAWVALISSRLQSVPQLCTVVQERPQARGLPPSLPEKISWKPTNMSRLIRIT